MSLGKPGTASGAGRDHVRARPRCLGMHGTTLGSMRVFIASRGPGKAWNCLEA